MEIPRRTMLKGAASLPLAAVLADPLITQAVAATTQNVTIKTASGKSISGAMALPQRAKGPTLLLVHEWWGLNDQIKAVAADYAKQGYVALAADLYGVPAATTAAGARKLMGNFMKNPKAGFEAVGAWVNWLRAHERGTGKVGSVGWCFGGGWSLNASIAAPVDATVIYYGHVVRPPSMLKKLKGPVLGHFATRDGWINKAMVAKFEAAMKAAGKGDQLTVHWYEADHAFANPSISRFNAAASKLAWKRTADFYKQNLS
jgi:carboxymethylenebutenolidase